MEKFSMYNPSKDAICEVNREEAEKFIASAREVEKQIADNDNHIDEEIAKLQAIKAKKGEKENEK